MSRQSEQAIGEADAVLLVVDAVIGVTEEDARIAELAAALAASRCSWWPTRSTTPVATA